jgi:hypothetical protein
MRKLPFTTKVGDGRTCAAIAAVRRLQSAMH